MYLNKEICKKCGGECCKRSGCLLSTRDLKGDIKKGLKNLIENRVITICSMPFNFFMLYAFEPYIRQFKPNPFIEKTVKLQSYSNVFIIKMRSINQDVFYEIQDVNKIHDLAVSGPCIYLTPKGCKYSDDERPYGGVQLMPDERGIQYCKTDFTVLDAALEWLEFHSIIEELWKKE